MTIAIAKTITVKNGFESAIGHESTAKVISTLLDIDCKMNRMQYQQQPGDTALVFKLKSRAPEGKILTSKEIEKIGYEWSLLERADTPRNIDPATGECVSCGLATGLNPKGECAGCERRSHATKPKKQTFAELAETCPQQKYDNCQLTAHEFSACGCCEENCAVWHFSR